MKCLPLLLIILRLRRKCYKDCVVCCICVKPEEAGRLEEDELSERKREEKQRARGPEGQRPLIPNKVHISLYICVCVEREVTSNIM